MMRSAEAEALLNRLCKTAREATIPQVDASAIEASVLARVARSSSDSQVICRDRSQRYFWPATILAAVALVSTAIVLHPKLPAPQSLGALASRPRDSATVLDGLSLTPGQSVEAGVRDLVVRHAGRATWTLRQDGRVRVVECGRQIALALESGRIDVNVVPQLEQDVFAVVVDQLRVSVHGTIFSVQRRGEVADVEVTEGAVRLQSLADGATTGGQLLSAPERLTINVRMPNVTLQQSSTVSAREPSRLPAPPPAKLDGTAAATDWRGRTTIPEQPAAEEIERLWDVVAREVADCFATRVGGDPDLHVSFATQLSVRILPSGSVAVADFDPAVPDPVANCVKERLTPLRTRPTKLGSLVTRPKVLVR